MKRLRRLLQQIDGRGYKAYKQLKGGYNFGRFQLSIDHVQGDPFAQPSRISLRIGPLQHGIPTDFWKTRIRQTALENFLGRQIAAAIGQQVKGQRGTGHSGSIRIATNGQQILRRNAVLIDEPWIEARLLFALPGSGRAILAGKAGHNREPHNHNDVGSFVLHAAGEDLLCDPGSARYDAWYFTARRYTDYIQAMSKGHSVPVVAGKLQGAGTEFSGRVISFDAAGRTKAVEMEISRAYPVGTLKSLRRSLGVAPGGRFILEDEFEFSGKGRAVEEAFVTWLPVRINGKTAKVRGEKSVLTLRIDGPGKFRLEEYATTSQKPGAPAGTLKRLVVKLPAARSRSFRLEGELKPRKRSRSKG